jgi:hypothetical protein
MLRNATQTRRALVYGAWRFVADPKGTVRQAALRVELATRQLFGGAPLSAARRTCHDEERREEQEPTPTWGA